MKEITPYTRSPLPTLPNSDRIWLERELQKLEAVNRALIEAVKTLDARLTALGG